VGIQFSKVVTATAQSIGTGCSIAEFSHDSFTDSSAVPLRDGGSWEPVFEAHPRAGFSAATFVCVDKKNLDRLAKDFGMVKAGLDYERYWAEIILRLQDSPWWKAPEPKNALENQAWQGRAAMLDAIFYDE
jgi:hypothetical protein